MNVPAQVTVGAEIIESVIAKGDLSKLTPAERNAYYLEVCRATGLSPITQPFAYISLQGRLVLYAKRDAADQLRKNNGVSIEIVSHVVSNDVLTVHVRAKDNHHRVDEDFGVVSMVYPERIKDRDGNWIKHPKAGKPLENEDRANAFLKAVTKAKRRVTLSICGLGLPDESEIEDVAPYRPQFENSTRPHPVEQSAPSRGTPPDPTKSGAGNDAEESRGEFIEACRDRIKRATDRNELGAWWNSEEQKRQRRDFGLIDQEVEDLKTFVVARLEALRSVE